MSNLAYCRFQNTLADLRDCYEHMKDSVNDDEIKARGRLLKLCKKIVEEYSDEN